MSESTAVSSSKEDEQKVYENLLALRVEPDGTESYGDKADQFIEWYGPEGAMVVTLLHGGSFRQNIGLDFTRPAAFALAEAGFRVALPEYRRLAGSPELTFEDARLLARHPLIGSSTWIGHCAGATMALDVLFSDEFELTHVVALAPLFDLARAVRETASENAGDISDFMGGMPVDQPERYAQFDPMRRWMELGEAQFAARGLRLDIIHGTADATVPVVRSKDLNTEPFNVAIVPGAHHNDVIRPGDDAWIFLRGALGDASA
ncbi:alpha/beta hydrolase family protein [Arcanobacterium canis]